MKKLACIIVSIMMMLSAGLGLAEAATPDDTGDNAVSTAGQLTGKITELHEDGSLSVAPLSADSKGLDLDVEDETEPDTAQGAAQALTTVRLTAQTRVECDWTLGVGDVVVVLYDTAADATEGIEAVAIGSYSLEGIVVDISADETIVTINSVRDGQALVVLPEGTDAQALLNKAVRVYHTGIAALSMPPQLVALQITEAFVASGEIVEVDDDSFLMNWEATQLRVNYDEHTKVAAAFAAGDLVMVYYNGIMTRSMPGQIHAQVVIAE